MSLLAVSGLCKRFGGVVAAEDVSFRLDPGEVVAMIGPNGAGKTTIFNMIGGQLRPDAGDIVLQERSIAGLPPRAIWRRGVGRTFQIAATFASMTLAENVQMALISRHRRLYGLWPPAGRLYRDAALSLLERVGMHDQAERPCGLLAYGDVKRVELAIALANAPKLLLMDEPTSGMAAEERLSLMRLIADIVSEEAISVLFTEHDMDVVFGHARRIIVLERGAVVAEGTPDKVRADPHVQEIYLGGGGA
ncbi:MAG: ABC transporter ATP-binding protein [Hyphomicrobiales bacterium]|nr:ABC transporter ATP-binding protein [Hyphomicrobiales bacterium]